MKVTEIKAGTRVTTTVGKYAGQFGTVQEANRGTVTNTEHENYGRAFVSVHWDPTPGNSSGEFFRPFADELTIVQPAPLPALKADASEPTWHAAQFDDLAVGDRVRFQTIDNGFGGSGDFILRTGTVTAVTARTLAVKCDPHRFGGDRARLTRAGWYGRSPQRAVVAAEEPAPTVDRQTAPAHTEQCRHGKTLRTDVTGDPIAACAKSDGGTEWGAFNNEGCTFVYDCAVEVANWSAQENEEAESTPEDPESKWDEMCRDHRDQEQPKDGCEECNAETDEDE